LHFFMWGLRAVCIGWSVQRALHVEPPRQRAWMHETAVSGQMEWRPGPSG